jgi:hypothetical protein
MFKVVLAKKDFKYALRILAYEVFNAEIIERIKTGEEVHKNYK